MRFETKIKVFALFSPSDFEEVVYITLFLYGLDLPNHHPQHWQKWFVSEIMKYMNSCLQIDIRYTCKMPQEECSLVPVVSHLRISLMGLSPSARTLSLNKWHARR
jgi:hypothetical protein